MAINKFKHLSPTPLNITGRVNSESSSERPQGPVVFTESVTIGDNGNPGSTLRVNGNSLITGISTISNLTITPVGVGATIGGRNVEYYGSFNIGIQSAGLNITTGVVTALNFIGAGNTFTYNASTKTVNISIAGGGGGGGYGSFNPGITTNTSATLTAIGGDILTLPSTVGSRYIIHSINASNIAIGNTEVNVIGAFDISGGERSYFAYNIPIPTGTSVELLKQPQVLSPSDKIVMRATDYTRAGIETAVQVHISYQTVTNTNLFRVGLGTVSIATTSATNVYTSTTYPSVIQSIRLTNRTDTGSYPASVTIVSGVTTTYLVDDLIVPKYGSVEILDAPKSLAINDRIQIILDQARSVDVQVSGISIV